MFDRIAIWDITSKCNLKCRHCYNQERYWNHSNQYDDLSIENIAKIIDKLVLLNFTRIHLLGGEPLLAPNINFITKYGKEKGLQVSMVSNGTLLTLERYVELYKLGMASINISLDGTNAEDNDAIRGKGTYDIVTKNLKDIKYYRTNLGKNNTTSLQLSFTLTRKSLYSSRNLVTFAHLLGLDGVTLSYLSNEGKARDNFEEMTVSQKMKFDFIDDIVEDYKKYKDIDVYIDARGWLGEYIYKKHNIEIEVDQKGCKGGDSQFYILADGTLLPCSPSGTSMGNFLKTIIPTKYPNVIRNSVEELKTSQALVCFYNFTNNIDTYDTIVPCNNCKYTYHACPLLYHENNIVEECIYAQKEVTQLDELEKKSIYKLKPNIRIVRRKKEMEILDFISHESYLLNEISLYIWEQIDGIKTVQEICQNLFEVIDENILYNQVEQDVLNFINKLKKLNFIEKR